MWSKERTRLTPIEGEALRVQQALVPQDGREHVILGPCALPPYWRCSCDSKWSNGGHPRPRPALPGVAERIERRDEAAAWINR